MRLYHYTALAHLIGEDGLSEVRKAWDLGAPDAVNGGAFAAPGSILNAGLSPNQCGDYDSLLAEPMPACVWLTTNPDMCAVFLNGKYLDHGNWRVTVVIPSTDRRLVHWPKYMRRRAFFEMQMSEWMRREAEGFFCYFGEVARDRIKAVDHCDRATAARAISNEDRARMARAA
jgi:hypothetical protein